MNEHTHITHSARGHGSVRSYAVGFALSIALTLVPYVLVVKEMLTIPLLIAIVVAAALAQLYVQLVYFLHIADGSKPRWSLVSFTFVAACVIALVGGTMWIFANLYFNMMPMPEVGSALEYMSEH